MLILTRRIDQAIVIRGNILVRVLGIQHGQVKLGITAPKEIIILREELCGDGSFDKGKEPQPSHT